MRFLTLLGASLLAIVSCGQQPAPRTLTVFAAASATDALRTAGERFEATTGTPVRFSFDSSATLARQIAAGAPAEVFLSADERWMDSAVEAGAMRPESRQDLLGNELVLVAPTASSLAVTLAKGADAAPLAALGRIAIGDPKSVPAGRYAEQSLEWLGWLPTLHDRLLPAKDVRAALLLVERGEAEAGIVYATDARASKAVRIVATFPEASHQPILYPIALTAHAGPSAAAFVEFLRGDEMARVFGDAGFRVLPSGGVAARPDGNR